MYAYLFKKCNGILRECCVSFLLCLNPSLSLVRHIFFTSTEEGPRRKYILDFFFQLLTTMSIRLFFINILFISIMLKSTFAFIKYHEPNSG